MATSITSPSASSNTTPSSGNSSNTSNANSSMNGLANEQVFLQLFVSQLKNQNPLNPADGTQFVTQLAQFSQLEQTLNMGKDVSAIRQVVAPSTSSTSTPSSTPSHSSSNTQNTGG
jgi:flagellar basal-body rod modification protein FlgD